MVAIPRWADYPIAQGLQTKFTAGNTTAASLYQNILGKAQAANAATDLQAKFGEAWSTANKAATARASDPNAGQTRGGGGGAPSGAPASDPNAGQTRSGGGGGGGDLPRDPGRYVAGMREQGHSDADIHQHLLDRGASREVADNVVPTRAGNQGPARPTPGSGGGSGRPTPGSGGGPGRPNGGPGGPGGGGPNGGGGGPSGPGPDSNQGAPAQRSPTVRSWLSKNVGVFGAAMGMVNEFHSQTAKGDYYRNIEGGSWGNALGERAREEGYAWNTMGVFNEEESKQAFQGVTRIGFNNRSDQRSGTKRREALDYVYDAKKSRGQSVGEGLEQVQAASKSLNVSLTSLQGAMEKVSDSAGKAGVNTEMARKQMLNYMSMGIQKGQGQGAVGFAQAVASTTVSYGKGYASTVDSSQMYSDNQMYRAASASGMSPGELYNLTQNDPAKAMQAYDKLNTQAMGSVGVGSDMQAEMKAEVDKIGGVDKLRDDPDVAKRIAKKFSQKYFASGKDPTALPKVLKNLTGKSFNNPEEAFIFMAEQAGGNTDAATAAKDQVQAETTDMTGKMADGSQNAGIVGSLDDFEQRNDDSGGFMGMGKDTSAALLGYKKSAEKSGRRDPVIEALLSNKEVQGDAGDDTHVKVMTGSGSKVLSLAEAVEQFPDQVAGGQVEIMDGQAAGKTTGELTEGKARVAKDDSEMDKTTESGTDAAEWDKTHKKPQEGGQTIGLSDEAKRWFVLKDSGGPINDAAATGNPPIRPATATRGQSQ